jgi:hypothetical protein
MQTIYTYQFKNLGLQGVSKVSLILQETIAYHADMQRPLSPAPRD